MGGDVIVNLDEYITKMEAGNGRIKELKKIVSDDLNSRILRLYVAYGEAKKTEFYGQDSLSWILSSLGEALKMADLKEASSLLKKDINASFICFWTEKISAA